MIILLTACTTPTLRKEIVRSAPSYAKPPANTGPLADIARKILDENGPDASGFKLLDKSYDGLLWRLVLIDSAVSSLGIQTYLWYPDSDGEPYWINSDEVLHTQPSRGGEQRVMNLIFKMFPRDQY